MRFDAPTCRLTSRVGQRDLTRQVERFLPYSNASLKGSPRNDSRNTSHLGRSLNWISLAHHQLTEQSGQGLRMTRLARLVKLLASPTKRNSAIKQKPDRQPTQKISRWWRARCVLRGSGKNSSSRLQLSVVRIAGSD